MPHRIIQQLDIANALVSMVELPDDTFEVALFFNGSWEDKYMARFSTEAQALDDFNRVVGILTMEAARMGNGRIAQVSLR